MNVTLPIEIERLVNDRLASGRYQSVGEVLAAAVQLLDEQERFSQARLESLRREIQLGIDDEEQGRAGPLDMHQFIAECHAEFEKRSK